MLIPVPAWVFKIAAPIVALFLMITEGQILTSLFAGALCFFLPEMMTLILIIMVAAFNALGIEAEFEDFLF